MSKLAGHDAYAKQRIVAIATQLVAGQVGRSIASGKIPDADADAAIDAAVRAAMHAGHRGCPHGLHGGRRVNQRLNAGQGLSTKQRHKLSIFRRLWCWIGFQPWTRHSHRDSWSRECPHCERFEVAALHRHKWVEIK